MEQQQDQQIKEQEKEEIKVETIIIKKENELFSNSKNCIIKQSKEKGRYVVANQDIKAGESIVFREKPYAFTMNYKDEFEKKICHYCFGLSSTTSKNMKTSPDQPEQCQDCKIVFYCSEYCKDQDYKIYHQQECSIYKKIQSSSQFDTQCKTSIKLLLKLIIKQYNEIKQEKLLLSSNDNDGINIGQESIDYTLVRFKDILTLETNLNKFPTTRVTDFNKISKFIEKSLDQKLLETICPTPKLVMEFQNNLIKLMCILECNSHDISFSIPSTKSSEYHYSSIGIGLFYHSSMFNHSCVPSICKVIESKNHNTKLDEIDKSTGNFATHSMIAIRDIKFGEEINFNYIQLTLSKVDRIKKLESSYHFICTCSSCKGNATNKQSLKSHEQFMEKYICKSKSGTCSGILFPLNGNLICNICRPIILK